MIESAITYIRDLGFMPHPTERRNLPKIRLKKVLLSVKERFPGNLMRSRLIGGKIKTNKQTADKQEHHGIQV